MNAIFVLQKQETQHSSMTAVEHKCHSKRFTSRWCHIIIYQRFSGHKSSELQAATLCDFLFRLSSHIATAFRDTSPMFHRCRTVSQLQLRLPAGARQTAPAPANRSAELVFVRFQCFSSVDKDINPVLAVHARQKKSIISLQGLLLIYFQ